MINGNIVELYHESISVSKNKQAMNVYVESLNSDIKLARRFYDYDESNKVAELFSRKHHEPEVIEFKDEIYYFEDWVQYMLSNSDYSEWELLNYEEHYQNLLTFEENTENFIEFMESECNCIECNGSGEGMYDGSTCSLCRGSGVYRED